MHGTAPNARNQLRPHPCTSLDPRHAQPQSNTAATQPALAQYHSQLYYTKERTHNPSPATVTHRCRALDHHPPNPRALHPMRPTAPLNSHSTYHTLATLAYTTQLNHKSTEMTTHLPTHTTLSARRMNTAYYILQHIILLLEAHSTRPAPPLDSHNIYYTIVTLAYTPQLNHTITEMTTLLNLVKLVWPSCRQRCMLSSDTHTPAPNSAALPVQNVLLTYSLSASRLQLRGGGQSLAPLLGQHVP